MALSPLAGRTKHTAVWPRSLSGQASHGMIVWGGVATSTGAGLPDGALYDPKRDQWTTFDTVQADGGIVGPAGRYEHVAVWDPFDYRMIVGAGGRQSPETSPTTGRSRGYSSAPGGMDAVVRCRGAPFGLLPAHGGLDRQLERGDASFGGLHDRGTRRYGPRHGGRVCGSIVGPGSLAAWSPRRVLATRRCGLVGRTR